MGPRQRRGERVAALTALLHQNPGRQFTLGELAELYGASRSSISEDLAVIREALAENDLGQITTQPGAAGGAQFVPSLGPGAAMRVIRDLCRELSDPRRVLAGGYIYMTDIIFSPEWAAKLGQVFALLFLKQEEVRAEGGRGEGAKEGARGDTSRGDSARAEVAAGRAGAATGGPGSASGPAGFRHVADCVVTVETKGIPLALMTARSLGIPLVVARRDLRVTEGSSVSINYVSGSTGHIQTMSLPRRALAFGSKVVVVDDFMKAGGVAKGLKDLMGEFDAKVLATGILTVTAVPEQKLVDDYMALTVLQGVDERRRVVSVVPGQAMRRVAE